jgi:cytochrome P450
VTKLEESTKLGKFDTENATDPERASRMLFEWLSDDDERADFYRCLLDKGRRALEFQSRANAKDGIKGDPDPVFHQQVYLLSTRDDVESALTKRDKFSNSPYLSLGSGTFMLGLDGKDHDEQRVFAEDYLSCLRYDSATISALTNVAFLAGAVQPLKQRKFDLVELSEQVALRFVGFLFGFSQADHVLLQESMSLAYRGADYQLFARHFVTDPLCLPTANVAMGKLLTRVAELIDLYRVRVGSDQVDEYRTLELELKMLRESKDYKLGTPLEKFEPILRRIAAQNPPDEKKYSGNELAVIMVGLIAGTIGNVQAGASIAINELFRDCERFKLAKERAASEWVADKSDGQLESMIWGALRLNPPVPFLPRKTLQHITIGKTSIPKDAIVVLAMGAAMRDGHPDQYVDNPVLDPLIFGGLPGGGGIHKCVGHRLAMALIARIVRQVLLLPGLCQSLDPRTGRPFRLRKLWGIMCQEYPLEYNREEILRQSPLIVVMNIKKPVSVHAEALKAIIKYGAPIIEQKLNDASHVHFASFLLIENDTKCILQTVYDRDFDAYIEYFALQIGPLFDLLFAHLEDAPPSPVSEFPKEFVDTIRRYNVRPAAGYFYSAYPTAEVSMIRKQFNREGT